MPNPTPGAASTTMFSHSIEVLLAKVDERHEHPAYGYMGFVQNALRDSAHRDVLRSKYIALKKRGTPYEDALNHASAVLAIRVESDTKQLLKYGQLLLCWPGTKVLEVPA